MDIIGNINKLKTADNSDGTKSAWFETIEFLGLKKYRVIPMVTPTEDDLRGLEETASFEDAEIIPESDVRDLAKHLTQTP